MKQNELVSIIVPAYNMEQYLEHCFRSIAGIRPEILRTL